MSLVDMFCKCGCERQVVKEGHLFIQGHWNRGKIRTGENAKKHKLVSQLCECGCEELTKPGNRFIRGHSWVGRKHTDISKKKISLNCKGNKGRQFTEEHKKKIGKANHENYKNGKHPGIGRKCTDEAKRRISIANMGINNGMYGRCGFNHYNWAGGKEKEKYCHIWSDQEYKNDIKERDLSKCQNPNCSKKNLERPLNIHHIDYDKLNCHPWNLITLCHGCNSVANFNREYWKFFYQDFLSKKCGYKELSRCPSI